VQQLIIFFKQFVNRRMKIIAYVIILSIYFDII